MKIKYTDFGRCLVCLQNPCVCKKKEFSDLDKLFDNPLDQVDKLVEEARELCPCGNLKADESDVCEECL
jgi:hypothetical protein